MFDAANFLMRWLFLCNLVRDVAEIQILPYNPHPLPILQPLPNCEEAWRDSCLRGILAYPPGTQRLLMMDALRTELVQKLSQSLHQADQTLQACQRARQHRQRDYLLEYREDQEDDPYLDADLEILKAFEQATSLLDGVTKDENEQEEDRRKAVLVIGNNRTTQDADNSSSSEPLLIAENTPPLPPPTREQVEDAQETIQNVRDYLPQLVSAVLRSPPAFDSQLVNPIQKLRHIIIQRCLDDANWGIDMCWLLEAEVGRAWKTLFEHRQQTGKRLIVVLPAEKAVVLAKIGLEKREAFDFLQDAEQATAYGYTVSMDEDLHHQQHPHPLVDDSESIPARLPSSLSLRRCSHFGDTMHFIDRLTRTSLDLRLVPTIHRLVSFWLLCYFILAVLSMYVANFPQH
jgi:hypothetical protein